MKYLLTFATLLATTIAGQAYGSGEKAQLYKHTNFFTNETNYYARLGNSVFGVENCEADESHLFKLAGLSEEDSITELFNLDDLAPYGVGEHKRLICGNRDRGAFFAPDDKAWFSQSDQGYFLEKPQTLTDGQDP